MSAAPQPVSRAFNFTDFQTVNPTTPLPGPQVDIELNNLVTGINTTIARLGEIQRADGVLQNGIAGIHASD